MLLASPTPLRARRTLDRLKPERHRNKRTFADDAIVAGSLDPEQAPDDVAY
jgi:hypothetical protein